MKVRIRDDMKVPRALKQHATHEVEKKKKFMKTKKLHLGNFTQRSLKFPIDVQCQINGVVTIFIRMKYA